jgi:DNA-binding NtrC family response regulator
MDDMTKGNRRIGRFEVVRTLGSGGMGEVFLVRDPLHPDRPTALKLLRHDVPGETLDRFRREFLALARNPHPHLLRAREFFRGRRRTCFTYDFVPGEDLSAWCRGRGWADARPVVLQLCGALRFLHSRGVLHLDLKPSNAIVGGRGGRPHLTLIDLGAHREEGSLHGARVLGTPLYAAPEVLEGRAPDVRSDLYSLGATLCRALTGRAPGEGIEAGDDGASDIPDEVGDLLRRLISRDPSRRPAGVEEVEDALRRIAGERAASLRLLPAVLPRERELASIQDAFDAARRGNPGDRLLLVLGEAGAGKSRLLSDARGEVERLGGVWAEASCSRSGMPGLPLERLADRLLGLLGTSAASRRLRRMVSPPAGIPAGPPSPFALRRKPLALEASSRFFLAASRERPLVLCLEDLHEAEPITVEALAYLLRALLADVRGSDGPRAPRLLLVAALRPGDVSGSPAEPALRDLLRGPARTIALEPWRPDEVRRFLSAALGGRRLPPGFAEGLRERTGGNPLLVDAALGALVEGGVLRAAGPAVALARPLSGLPIPARIEEALRRRLERLPGAERDLLRRIALLSRPFDADGIPPSWLRVRRGPDTLGNLAARSFLMAAGSGGKIEYALSYPGLGEVLRKGIGRRAARRIHGEIATFLEGREGAPPEVLAFHRIEAGDATRGIGHARAAGERLRGLDRLEFLRWAYDRAARLLPARSAARIEALDSLAEVLEEQGEHSLAEGTLRRILAERTAAARRGIPFPAIDRLCLLRRLAALACHQGKHRRAFRILARVPAAPSRLPEERIERLRLSHEEARALLLAGRTSEADGVARANLSGIHRLRRRCPERLLQVLENLEPAVLNGLGAIRSSLCLPRDASRYYAASLARLRGRPPGILQAGILSNLANLDAAAGRHRMARARYEEALRTASRAGALDVQSLLHGNLAAEALVQWDLRAAAASIEAAKDLAERIDARRHISFALILEGALLTRRGEPRAALEALDEAERKSRLDGDRYLVMNALLQAAYPALFLGLLDRAREAAREGTALAAELRWPRGIVEGRLAMGTILLHAGSPAEARAELRAGLEAPEGRNEILDVELRFFHGRALRSLGHLGAARRDLVAALQDYRHLGAGPMALEAALSLAGVEVLRGRRRSASAIAAMASTRLPPLLDVFVVLEAAGLILEIAEEGGRGPAGRYPDGALRAMERRLSDAAAICRRMGSPHLEWRVLALLARTCARRGSRRASGLFGSARRAAEVALSRLSPDIGSRYVRSDAWVRLLAPGENLPSLPGHACVETIARSLEKAREEAGRLRERLEAIEGRREPAGDGGPAPSGHPGAEETRELPRVRPFDPLGGASRKIRSALAILDRAAASEVAILISGEAGTGKGAAARRIHERSPRSSGPFVDESPVSIPEALLESELFGHAAGAFTDARADHPGRIRQAQGGTLFIEEICEVPLAAQRKLLPALRDGRVRPVGSTEDLRADFRLIASSSRPLDGEVRAGRFLPDLARAVAVVEVRLPALRERREDIEGLVKSFIESECARTGRRAAIDEDAMEKLRAHDWPGNVRELENVLRRLLVLCGERIRAEDIDLGAPPAAAPTSLAGPAGRGIDYREARERLERDYLIDALRRSDGNVSAAARLLGLHRRSLYKKMRRLGLSK